MKKTNSKTDTILSSAPKWQEETEKLTEILLDCGLTKEVKWKIPCFTFQKNNIVAIQGFKKYFALLFFKGLLLKDPNHILKKTGPNTHVGRQIRFTNVQEIVKAKTILKKYIQQAIEVEKSGVKVKPKNNKELQIPEEFQEKLDEMPHVKEAWESLTPGRQRGYIFYFSSAKNPETRESRIEKCIDLILDGVGLHDHYKQ